MKVSCQSMVGELKTLLLKDPRDAFVSDEQIALQWKDLNYTAPPRYDRSVDEFDRFVEPIRQCGVEIHFLPRHELTGLDSIYTHDPVITSERGVILGSMGKRRRRPELQAMTDFFRTIGVPVLGAITGDGKVEGGDVVWLDERTVAVGRGYRTNAEGIAQLRALLGQSIDELIEVPLPHWNGPEDVLHLMSFLSMIDRDLAVAASRVMPVFFREKLRSRGIELIEVPPSEYDTLGCNILALAPRKCLMVSGNPLTKQRLERAQVEVLTFDGVEICLKGSGGPTCLSRPLLRI